MADDGGLIVRHTQRHEISVPCRIDVANAHAAAVRFTPVALAQDGRVSGRIVDVSAGGLGVETPVFVPRNTLVRITTIAEQSGQQSPPIDVTLRIKRVIMIDREPTYLLGLSVTGQDDGAAQQIQDWLQSLEGGRHA